MKQIGAFEAKNTLGSLLDCVERGEEITITQHGKAVARLVSIEGVIDREKTQEAAARIRTRAECLPRQPFDWELLKASRDLDRP